MRTADTRGARQSPGRAGVIVARRGQKYDVSNTAAFRQAKGWRPRIDHRRGIKLLAGRLAEHIVPAERQGIGSREA